ncbi:MAG TPA: cytochrome c [Gammaproteobacteria bacterium]|nr:cytochrome c [Gammaproteobacteria bacterium]
MNARRTLALVAAAGCALVAAQASAQSPTPRNPLQIESPAGDTQARADSSSDSATARGKALYARFGCYECHQYSGSGYQGAPGGAPLVPLPLTLEAFKAYLRNPPTPRRMPPYTAKVLTDAEADALYAFIRSLPPPPPVAQIPLLESIAKEIEGRSEP